VSQQAIVPPRARFARASSLPLVAILFAVVACGGADASPAKEDAAVIPVRVVTPEYRRTQPPIVLTGTLGAKEEIPLAFKIGGVVARVAVEAGQAVREGDVLAELSLAEIDAQVSAAREGRDKAKRDYDRAMKLLADSVVTAAQAEDARTGLDVAEAQLRAAEFNQRYAVVRATADGVVLRRQLEVGQLVGPGAPVIVLRTERKGLVLRAAAADRDAVRLKEGDVAKVTFDAFPERSFNGRVERVAIAATLGTGTYETEIAVSAGGARLASGLIGRATLQTRSATALPTIPAEALLEVDGDKASVFVLTGAADGKAATVRRVVVRVAFLTEADAAIASGLDSSMRVVTAGATRLSDGARVSVTAERAP
jgi:multidrug efflux system membrane fusion protein